MHYQAQDLRSHSRGSQIKDIKISRTLCMLYNNPLMFFDFSSCFNNHNTLLYQSMQRFTPIHEQNAIKVKSCLDRIFSIVRHHGDIIYNQLDILKKE